MSNIQTAEEWQSMSAVELCALPEMPKRSMRQFHGLASDLIDCWAWDRLSDGEIVDKLRGYQGSANVTDEQIADLIQERRDIHEENGILLPLAVEPDTDKKPKYVVPRRDKNHAGWFQRGQVSLVAGSSGMGKTTLLLYLLEDMRDGRSVHYHPPVVADYVFGLYDRPKDALAESLEHKGLDTDGVLERAFPIEPGERNAPKAIDRILRQWKRENRQQPDVFVIEGIDFMAGRVNDPDVVVPFVKGLLSVAEAWNIAIIGTTGSPKQKEKDSYRLTRDSVIGTGAWSRMSNTIVHVALHDDNDENGARQVTVLPRTGRNERFYFHFDEGLAVFSDVPPHPGLKALNGRHPDRDEVAELRAVVAALPSGTKLDTRQLPGTNAEKPNRLKALAQDGIVEKRGRFWYRK